MIKAEKLTYTDLGHEGSSHYEHGEDAVDPCYVQEDIGTTSFELTMSMFGWELDEEAVTKIRDTLNGYLKDVSAHKEGRLKNG
jgi:hypothetical protein